MRLTPPTNYVFFSSAVLVAASLAIYLLGVFGVVEGAAHFAFWIALAGWLAVAVGVVAKGV